MGRSQETFNKKEVRNKKAKKKKDKAEKKLAKKDVEKSGNLEDMLAYVDEFGNITSTPPDPNKKKIEIKSENIEINTPKREAIIDEDIVRKGIVTFFNSTKGFGFIKDSVTQESVFVHVNNLIETIKENNVVTFEMGAGPKGPTATQVKLFK